MSDSDESGVTHTEISSPFEDLSDIGSPGVVGPEHEGLPWMLDDPYEQPLPAAASPTAQSPDYVPESDPEANPEEDDDDSLRRILSIILPMEEMTAPSAEETEPFETDEFAATPPPHPAYHVTAMISIPAQVPTPVWSDAEVARLLTISTPPSSPLSPWSLPLPQIPSLPLPLILSPSLPVSPPLPIRPLGYQAAMIRLRAKAASTSYSLPLPLPIILSYTRPDAPSSGTPHLHLLFTDRREDRPKVTLPPRKRLGIALGPAYEVGKSSSAAAARPAGGLRADYGFVATMDREIRRDLERDRMTEFETRVRRDTNEVYTRLDDEQSGRQLLAGQLNMLFRDRRAHAQVMSLRTTVLAQQSQIRELQSADRRRQTVITEMLAADHKRQVQLTKALKLVKRLQTQMAELQRQQGPAKGPAQPELPEEAGSSS
ncbi:hypothetical protein Tco_0458811 [Tanacetum coccineum]